MNQNSYTRVLKLGGQSDLGCPLDAMRHALKLMQPDAAYRTLMHVNLPDLNDFLRP